MARRSSLVIDFLETLKAPDGTTAGQPFVVRDWQKNIIREIYDPARPDGRRIVRQAVLSMARKNGKTALVAGLCLAHLCGPEAIRNGQLYSLSIDSEQAGILFNYARAMVEMDEELSQQLNIRVSPKQIYDPVSGSLYMVLSGEKKGKMGKSSSFIAFDELAEFGTDRTLYDALVTSTGAHKSPLIWVFSTQSPDDRAVLSELVDYGEKVSRGEIEDETFKGFLLTVPMDDDPWEESNWHKANPALGDFRSLEEMRNFANKAKVMPSAEASFRNLYLNQRVDASEHFITPMQWKACAGAIDFDIFRDRPVYAGLDLSGKNDLTALVLTTDDDDGDWHIWPHFWTPGENLRERADRDRAPYVLWRDQRHLNAKPGKTIDYRWVARQIAEIHADIHIELMKFDRWRIDDLARELDREGVEVVVATWEKDPDTGGKKLVVPDHDYNALVLVPHGQGYQDMNPAVEVVEDLITETKLRHGGHPVLTWCASNTRIQADPAGGRKFDKLKSTGRIDGMVAMAMALNGAAGGEAESREVQQGFVDLDNL